MSLSIRKCWYSNYCLHFWKCAVPFGNITFHFNTYICFFLLFLDNRTARIRHLCRKTIVLSCHRCPINVVLKKWTSFKFRFEFWLPDVSKEEEMLVLQQLFTFLKRAVPFGNIIFHFNTYLCFFPLFLDNRTACSRHLCRKTIVLSCHRCLINTGVKNEQHLNVE
jgi:hypothetical protein